MSCVGKTDLATGRPLPVQGILQNVGERFRKLAKKSSRRPRLILDCCADGYHSDNPNINTQDIFVVSVTRLFSIVLFVIIYA